MIMFSIPCYSSSIGSSLKIKIDTTANSQKFSTACINNCTGYDVRESKQTTVFEHKIG